MLEGLRRSVWRFPPRIDLEWCHVILRIGAVATSIHMYIDLRCLIELVREALFDF